MQWDIFSRTNAYNRESQALLRIREPHSPLINVARLAHSAGVDSARQMLAKLLRQSDAGIHDPYCPPCEGTHPTNLARRRRPADALPSRTSVAIRSPSAGLVWVLRKVTVDLLHCIHNAEKKQTRHTEPAVEIDSVIGRVLFKIIFHQALVSLYAAAILVDETTLR